MTDQQQAQVTQAEVQPAMNQPLKPHRGVMILIFGILGILCCFIFGIVAWVMGNNDIREMDAGLMDPEGKGLTQAGKICGIIGVVLAIIGIVIQLIMMMVGGGLAIST